MSDKDPDTGRFLPGNSGFSGRPKGSRNRLGEQFLSDLQADWEEHGAKAIEETRIQKPAEYVKVVASLLPKEMVVTTATDGMTESQMEQALAIIDGLIAARDAGQLGGHTQPTHEGSGTA